MRYVKGYAQNFVGLAPELRRVLLRTGIRSRCTSQLAQARSRATPFVLVQYLNNFQLFAS